MAVALVDELLAAGPARAGRQRPREARPIRSGRKCWPGKDESLCLSFPRSDFRAIRVFRGQLLRIYLVLRALASLRCRSLSVLCASASLCPCVDRPIRPLRCRFVPAGGLAQLRHHPKRRLPVVDTLDVGVGILKALPPGGVGVPGDVRGEDDVLQLEKRIVRSGRFLLQHIQPRSGDGTVRQCPV